MKESFYLEWNENESSVRLIHYLCVLVVRCPGWPMSLWVMLGLKYSSAVTAKGFVAGHDIWVTIVFYKIHTHTHTLGVLMIKEQILDRLCSLTPLLGPMCCSAIPRKDCRGVLPPETKAQHSRSHYTRRAQSQGFVLHHSNRRQDKDAICLEIIWVGIEILNHHIHYDRYAQQYTRSLFL